MRVGVNAGLHVPRGLLYRWFVAKGITIPQQVIVPDISFYQSSADFERMKANGARGVIIRAGQNAWIDPKFATFWKEAKAAGLPRGTYFYYDSRISPEEQADLFYQQFATDMPEMEIVADYEESYDGPWSGWQNLKKFLERLHMRGIPYSQMAIYTGYYYWRDHSPQGDPLELSYFKQFRLWLAWYTSNPDVVTIPDPWTNAELLFWQFTSNGDGPAYGVGSLGIDLSYFNGSPNDFDERYETGATQPEPEPPNGGNMKTIFTNGATLETWQEFDHEIHVLTIPPDAIELASFHYTPGEGHLAEEHVNNAYKVFFNFAPYDFSTKKVNEGLKIGGVNYHDYVDYDPWLEWKSNVPNITHVKAQWKNVQTGAQGFRYVFENGAITPTANAEWNTRYAQRVIANDTHGNTIIFSSSGEPDGLNLNEVADILYRWVADGHGQYPIGYALQGDSGHSVQTAYFKDTLLELFVGPRDGDRNQPVCYGYLRLRTPLITDSAPPPDPEPDPGLKDIPVEIVLGDDQAYEKQVIHTTLKPKQ